MCSTGHQTITEHIPFTHTLTDLGATLSLQPSYVDFLLRKPHEETLKAKIYNCSFYVMKSLQRRFASSDQRLVP